MKNRTARSNFSKNSYWAVIVVLVVACAAVLTKIVEVAEQRFQLEWDLTANQIYSIGEESERILKGLNQDIVIYTVYPQGGEDQTIHQLLRRYTLASPRIEVKNIDPLSTPFFTQQFEEDGETVENSSIIVTLKNDQTNFRVIRPQNLYEWSLEGEQLYATGMIAEQRVTSAIQSLMGGKQSTVYFIEGHGEATYSQLYFLTGTLENDEYKTKSYHLIYNDTHLTADDCVVFVAPSSDLSEEELPVLQAFLRGGGKAIFFINPLAPELPRFNGVLDEFGLSLESNLVVEGSSDHYLNNQVILVPEIREHGLTAMLTGGDGSVVLPLARSVNIRPREGVSAQAVLETSSGSYAKTDSYTETLEREAGDADGPFILAAAAEQDSTGAKVVVMGTSDFITTLDNARYANNLALFMSSVSWTLGQQQSVIIQPKSLVNPPLGLTSVSQVYMLMGVVVIAMPVAVILVGIFVWRRRKVQ